MLCSPELEARGEHKANHVLFHGAIVSPLPSLLLIKPQQSLPVLHPIAKLAFFCRCQECREIMAAFEHGDHAAQSQLSAQFLAVLVLDDYMLDFGVSCIASPPHPVCGDTDMQACANARTCSLPPRTSMPPSHTNADTHTHTHKCRHTHTHTHTHASTHAHRQPHTQAQACMHTQVDRQKPTHTFLNIHLPLPLPRLPSQLEYAPKSHDYIPRVIFADPDGKASPTSPAAFH